MHFDGLSRSMHMEIKYSEETSELSLTHRGYLVYKEVMGDLEVYVPNEEWESWIEKLWMYYVLCLNSKSFYVDKFHGLDLIKHMYSTIVMNAKVEKRVIPIRRCYDLR